MTTADFLNISLGSGFLILVGFLCYTLYQLAQTVKSAKKIVDDAEDITRDVRVVKNQLKAGALGGLTTALNIASIFFKKKGGEKKHEQR